MNWFLKVYKWAMNTKFIMGMYFLSMLFVYCGVILIEGGRAANIIFMFEMLITSMAMAVIEKLIFPYDREFAGRPLFSRTCGWFVLNLLTAILAALGFGWFTQHAAWSFWVFACFMALVLALMWIGFNVADKIDTKNLNKKLNDFKAKQRS